MNFQKKLIALTISILILPTISHADNSNSCAALLKIGIYNLAQSDNVVDSDLLKKSSFCAYDYNKIQTSPSQMALIEDAYKLFGNVGGATSLAQITDAQTRVCAAGFGSDIYRTKAKPFSQNVYQDSLDAWDNCQNLDKQGVVFSIQQPDSKLQSVTATLSVKPSYSAVTLNSLQQSGTGHSICKATLAPRNGSFSGKTIAVDDTTSLKFDATNKITITCNRQMANNGKGDLSADAQRLSFNTSAGDPLVIPLEAIGSLSRMSVDKAMNDIQSVVDESFKGAVLAFTSSSCPTGWNEYTEGQGKFILGANSVYPFGQTGGETNHQLTIAEIPSHSHDTVQMIGDNNIDGVDSTTTHSGDHHNENRQTGLTGENQPFSIMPPFKALTFCKKL